MSPGSGTCSSGG